MICTLCGQPYPCVHTQRSTAVLAHTETLTRVDENETGHATLAGAAPRSSSQPVSGSLSLDDLAAQVRQHSDQRTWREEVSLRVNRHRARRHRMSDHASLELDFPADEALAVAPTPAIQRRPGLPPSVPLDMVSIGKKGSQDHALHGEAEARHRPRKVIRFPAQSAVEVARPPALLITEIELAEPLPATPRIMEGPPAEQMELLPSFADIRLEEAPQDNSLSGELDLPLRPAPLGQRLLSALVDGGIVLLALGIFAFSFAKIAPIPFRAELLSVLATGTILWILFQYLFLVYGTSTPGMRAAQLQLRSFDGNRASSFARRSRALASALSVISVGLGFAWALVDEDTLGWHDRISRTYLKSGDRVIGRSGDL